METKHTFVPPYRVGRNQGRVILDSLGHEVGIFSTGFEAEAQKYCDYLNNGNDPIELKFNDGELEFNDEGFNLDMFKKQFDENFSKIEPSAFIEKMIGLGYVFKGISIEEPNQLTVEDYKDVIEDNNRLVRELDVILNGNNAAIQASLSDIVSQVKNDFLFHTSKWDEFVRWLVKDEEGWRYYEDDKIWKLDGWRNRTTEQLFKWFHKQDY